MTPRARSSASSWSRRLAAPRPLNEPVIWRFSSLTNQRAVADAPRELAREAAGGGGGGDRAVRVQGDGADRSLHRRQSLVMAHELALGDERLRVALGKPLRPGKGEGAVADEEDVAARLHDPPGERERIGDPAH